MAEMVTCTVNVIGKSKKLLRYVTFLIIHTMNIKFGALGAGATSHYVSGSGSTKMMWLLAASAPKH
jgi:hypothetical protein